MYETTIGLEIHVQLKTKSKMFCSCPNVQTGINADLPCRQAGKNADQGGLLEKPNIRICPICMGFPGVLPSPNKQAIEWTLLCGLALGCKVSSDSKFDRKSYFYPDLPKGYQISQYDLPFSKEGFLDIEVEGKIRRIKIRRVHLEEDTAKLIHPSSTDYSLVDFNRSGVPLLEIVSEPDLASPEEARIFAQSLQQILRYLEISDADMEKGQFRCDANISLKKKDEKLGIPVEIKNMNSHKALERALEYEVKRQTEILEGGEEVRRETRGFDESKQKTISQRGKEIAPDYRYFPEPDLPPILVTSDKGPFGKAQGRQEARDKGQGIHLRQGYGGQAGDKKTALFNIEDIKASLPELPLDKKRRFISEYGLGDYDASLIASDKNLANYYEEVMSELLSWEKIVGRKDGVGFRKAAKIVANWFSGEYLRALSESGQAISSSKITPENFAEFICLILERTISTPLAKQIFQEMFKSGKDPSVIIQEYGLHLVTDLQVLEKVIEEVISKNQKAVSDYKKGKMQALKYLVGQVMRKTSGAADPKLVAEILDKRLKNL